MSIKKKIKALFTVQLSKKITASFLVLSVVSLLYMLYLGPIMTADSLAYQYMVPNASPGYPVFLYANRLLFNDLFGYSAMLFHYVVLMGSIWGFMNNFMSKFTLKNYQLFILLGVLFYPVFDGNLWVLNNIATEGICYALFLCVIMMYYQLLNHRTVINAGVLALLTMVLIAVRGQFQFLVLLYLMVEVLLWWKHKKVSWVYVGLIFCIPLLTGLLDKGYHKIVHKKAFSTPFTWVTLNTSLLYYAVEEDASLIAEEEARAVFLKIIDQLEEKKVRQLDHKYHSEPIDYNYIFYHYEYPTICNQTGHEEAIDFYMKKHKGDLVQSYIDANKVHKRIFLALWPNKINEWFNLGLQSFKFGMGGLTIALLYIIVACWLIVMYFKALDIVYLFPLFLIATIVLNKAIVGISVHSIIRYFFYTNWIPIFLLFLGFNNSKFTLE